jgi:hypothetical protein
MPKRITPKYKRVVDPLITKRDGNVCFFDKMPFVPEVLKWSKTYLLMKNAIDFVKQIQNTKLCRVKN